MDFNEKIGEISVKDNGLVEWTIRNIFSHTGKDELYASPHFCVSDTWWCFHIDLNGTKIDNSVGWINLYLYREIHWAGNPIGANFTFGVKRADGTVERLREDATWVFDRQGDTCGGEKLLQRCVLLSRREERTQLDALTLTCSLRVIDSSPSRDPSFEDLLDLFTSKTNCDATLKVEDQEFAVHKCILSARSPVFAAMFDHDMKEKNTRGVDIVDCDPRAFKDFLVYLYSGKTENLSANDFELCRIADQYDVKGLKYDCLVHIMGNLSPENICDAVTLADQFSNIGLKTKTQRFFVKHSSQIVRTAKFKSLMETNELLAQELLDKVGWMIVKRKRK